MIACVSETEEEVESQDGDTWSSAEMFCLPRDVFTSPRRRVELKKSHVPPFKAIHKDMQSFLAKRFSFDDHDGKEKSYFSTLPSLLRKHQGNSMCEFLSHQDCQTLSLLRPMKKHFSKCRKRFITLETVTKLLRQAKQGEDTATAWATTACRSLQSECSEGYSKAMTTKPSAIAAGEKVDIGMTTYTNCPGRVVKELSE